MMRFWSAVDRSSSEGYDCSRIWIGSSPGSWAIFLRQPLGFVDRLGLNAL